MQLSEKTLKILSHPAQKNFMDTIRCYHDENESSYYLVYEEQWAIAIKYKENIGAMMITNEPEFFKDFRKNLPPQLISMDSALKSIIKLYFEGKTKFPITMFQMITLMGDVLPQEIIEYQKQNPPPADSEKNIQFLAYPTGEQIREVGDIIEVLPSKDCVANTDTIAYDENMSGQKR